MQAGHHQSDEDVAALMEDYLDHLLAPLVGKAPYDLRMQLRAELRDHLEALAEAREELGESREEAAAAALRQFGDPAKIAREWLDEWRPKSAVSLRSVRNSAACFVPAFALAWFTVAVLSPVQTPPATFFVLVVIPLFAGFFAGVLAQARPGSSTLFGVLGLALGAGLLGLIEAFVLGRLDQQTPWPLSGFAAIAALIWAPLGAIAAAVGGAVRRRVLNALRAAGSI